MTISISKGIVSVITQEYGIESIKYFTEEHFNQWVLKERKRKLKIILGL